MFAIRDWPAGVGWAWCNWQHCWSQHRTNCHPSDADRTLFHTNTHYHSVQKHTQSYPSHNALSSSSALLSHLYWISLCLFPSLLPTCVIWSELCQAELAWIKKAKKAPAERNPPEKKKNETVWEKENEMVSLVQNLITLIRLGHAGWTGRNEVERRGRIRTRVNVQTERQTRTEQHRKRGCMQSHTVQWQLEQQFWPNTSSHQTFPLCLL